MLRNLFLIFLFFISLSSCKDKENISLFPLDNYSQSLSDWFNPNNNENDKILLTPDAQTKRLAILYEHYYGASSPWSPEYINKILKHSAPDDIFSTEKDLVTQFSNQNKSERTIGYGENFHPYPNHWITDIEKNIHFAQFEHLQYDPNKSAIAVDNAQARVLPTDDVYFYHHKIAGQGYPFDNLQMSALWAGTPVYVLGETLDHAWLMVITPDFIAWVKSNTIAYAHSIFIQAWQLAAKKQLAAITRTKTSIVDLDGNYHFLSYVGSLFPSEETSEGYKISIPVSNTEHVAETHFALVTREEAKKIPLSATPRHFLELMPTLLGRPYGWGNLYFYNDCSAELKSIFTPFGIWLPRHSSDQVAVGKLVDQSSNSPEQRINYLMSHGHRFMTLLYIGGHIMLYIGNHPNPHAKDHSLMALTYQNIWGLKPNPPKSRSVIGKSVLFPLLLRYPEDPHLTSLAARKLFQVSFLDEPSDTLRQLEIVDLKSLMYP